MSIRKREWQTPKGENRLAWLVDYTDASGNRRHKQFQRKKEAEAFETKTRHELQQGLHTPDRQSIMIEQAGDNWIARARREGLEESTIDPYRQHLDLHILGKDADGKPQSPLAGRRLNQLSTPEIEKFRDWLLDNGRSRAMAKRVLGSLSAILNEAQRHGFVARNVAKGVTVKISGREKAKVVPPTKAQIRLLIEAAGDADARPMDKPMMLVLLFAGLRASELRGLAWSNVDLKAGSLTIDQRADRKNVIGPPKSKSGFRTIPIPQFVVQELKAWKLRCRPSVLDLVFPSERGTPIFHANIGIGFLQPVQQRAGLVVPQMRAGKPVRDSEGQPVMRGLFTLHDFRHACASLWIEQHVVPKRVQTWMGHHSIQVTFDTYGHLFESADQDAGVMAALEAGIMGAANER